MKRHYLLLILTLTVACVCCSGCDPSGAAAAVGAFGRGAAGASSVDASGVTLATPDLSGLEGGKLIAHDGLYLGTVTQNKYASESVGNTYGIYGSNTSSTSIMNNTCQYGSPTSSLSAFNNVTSTPPMIVLTGNRYIYLTTNPSISPAISPYILLAWMNR